MASEDEQICENGEDVPQVNGKKQHNTLLDHFNKLTSKQPKWRLKSACQIVRNLNRKDVDDAEKSYTITRLVRGLSASKLPSRIGYFTALTVVLKRTNYDANAIFDVVQKELHTSGQFSKSENADILTGLILLTGAILRSGQFGDLEDDHKKKVLQQLIDASTKKTYLALLASSLVVDSLPQIPEKQFAEEVLPVFRPSLKKELEVYTLDNLYLLLKFEEVYSNTINSKFLQNLLGSKAILQESNILALINVLTNIIPIKNIHLHPVYQVIASKLANSSILSKFLIKLDEKYKFTHIKHVIMATLLSHIVGNISEDYEPLKYVFGKNFLRETITYFKNSRGSKTEDEVKMAVSDLLNSIATRAKDVSNSDIKIQVMKSLMFYPGTFIFEKVTGSKILQQITSTLDASGVQSLAKIYKQVMLASIPKHKDAETTEPWLNLDRVFASQLLVKLVNHPSVKAPEYFDWKLAQLQQILEVSLLKHDKVGADLAKNLKETFFAALDVKISKLQDFTVCSSKLVHVLNENLENCRHPLDTEALELWQKTFSLVEKLEKKAKKTHLTSVFHVLFLQMGLQLFNDSKLASDSLKELFECYERRKSNDLEVNWIEVVVDLFLNLLSHNSHLLRSIVNRVFPHLCKHLTPAAVHQVLHVLDPQSDNPLAENISSDEEDADEEDEDKESEDEEDEDDEEEDSSDEEDDDNNDEEDAQMDKLRLALQDALLGGKPIPEEMDDIDVDDLSDGECEKLNIALGEAFKRFRPNLSSHRKSKKQSKDDETLTHFRVRVLDLIDIYLDSQEVSMLIALEIMLPLLQTLEFSIRDAHQKPLLDRIKGTIKKLSSLKHFASMEDVSESILCTLLESILDKGSKSALMVQEMGDKISECCTFIITCSSAVSATASESKKKKSKVANIIVKTLGDFFMKRDSLTPFVLFKNIMGSPWKHAVLMVEPLVSYVFNEEVRPFRRRQALELLRIFYLNNRLMALHNEAFKKALVDVEKKFVEQTFEFFKSQNYKIKESFLSNLFSLLVAMKNCVMQTEAFDWPQLGSLIREYRSGVSFKTDTKLVYNKLCGALKVPNVVQMKKNVVKLSAANAADQGADVDDEDEEEAEEKKKKGNKQAKKLKKQARELRMASLSEGMPKDFKFGSTNIDDLNAMDVSDDEDKKDIKNETSEVNEGDENAKKTKKKSKKSKETKQENGDDSSPKRKRSSSQGATDESPKKRKKKQKQKV